MAWTAPRTWVAGELVTAALMNTHVRDNLTELRAGGIAIASQGANEIIRASSSTQFARSSTFVFDGTKMGIGTASPGEPIDLLAASSNPTATTGGLLMLRSNNAEGIDLGGSIAFGGYRDAAASILRTWAGICGYKENATAGNEAGYLALYTNNNGTLTEALRINSGGAVFISDTLNAFNTKGLTINQLATDDECFSVKSSDVAHGMTTDAETDTYGILGKVAGADGGLLAVGYTEVTEALRLHGKGVTDNTTKSTAATAYVAVGAFKKSGTTVGDCGADANLMIIRNNATCRFIFDAEGSAHADVEWITFDSHDDVALLDALDTRMSKRDAVTNAFGEALRYRAAELQDAGIVNFYDDGPRAMVNFTRLAMLHTGALRQVWQRTMRQDEAIARLAAENVRLLADVAALRAHRT